MNSTTRSKASADSAAQEQGGDIVIDNRPTHDQIYLAEKVNDRYEGGSRGLVTPAVLQRWNRRYGVVLVSDALRLLHGFPPGDQVRSPYAYLAHILEAS